MKKVDFNDRQQIKKYFEILDVEKHPEFTLFLNEYVEKDWSVSKKLSRIKIFIKILINNNDNFFELYEEYFSSRSIYTKLKLKYGEDKSIEFKEKLENRPKRKNNNSTFNKKFWKNKGFSDEEARDKLEEIQNKAYAAKKSKGFTKLDRQQQSPLSKKFWKNKGFSDEEAEKLRKPYLYKCPVHLDHFIIKYGEEEGKKKYSDILQKRQATKLERYGTLFFYSNVSKESIKFFIPLYKKLRKMGIKKNDIMWGIRGSKEFTTKFNNKNYSYDFVIRSLKICIEYNNEFWHVHEDRDWKGFLDIDEVLTKEILKKKIIENIGFNIFYVWNFDNIIEKQNELLEIIKNEYNRRKMFVNSI